MDKHLTGIREDHKRSNNPALSRAEKKEVTDKLVDMLRPLRAKLGLSQREISEIIDMALSTYNAIELKKKELPWRYFLACLFFYRYNPHTRKMIEDSGILAGKLDCWLNVYKG